MDATQLRKTNRMHEKKKINKAIQSKANRNIKEREKEASREELESLTQEELIKFHASKFKKMFPEKKTVDYVRFMKILEEEKRIKQLKEDKKRLMSIAKGVLN